MISAKTAAESIAGFVEKSWPYDRDSIFNILDLVQETIWKAGLFENPTKWFYARVNKDNTIVTPDGYNVLIGVRLKGFKTLDLRDELFMFHENGPMLDPGETSNFTKHVQFIGCYPTLINHINDAKGIKTKPFKIGVSAECVSYKGDPPIIIVSGKNECGKRIYTYNYKEFSDPEIIDEEKIQEYHTEDIESVIEGVMYNSSSKMIIYENVLFSDIYNIRKEPTPSRVNVFAIKSCNTAVKIATLDPFDTESSYNIYSIPGNVCQQNQAFCLFKKSKPSNITNDSQLILTSSKTALISLAKGVYQKFHKDNIQVGDKFISDGLAELQQLLIASNPNVRNQIQFRDTRMASVKNGFKNFR